MTDVRLKRALEDGQEQLARMNYFHEMREIQQRQQQQQQHDHLAAPPNSRRQINHHQQHHNHHHSPSHAHSTTHGASSSSPYKHFSIDPTGGGLLSWSLSTFLHIHLPGIQEEDLKRYEKELIKDGFDSMAMIKYLEREDISTWKKAHRRAMLSAVAAMKKEEG